MTDFIYYVAGFLAGWASCYFAMDDLRAYRNGRR